jgi:hypothetical protein
MIVWPELDQAAQNRDAWLQSEKGKAWCAAYAAMWVRAFGACGRACPMGKIDESRNGGEDVV